MRRAAVLAAALLVLVAVPAVARADVSAQQAIAIAKQQPEGRDLLLSHPDARFTARRAGSNWLVLARQAFPTTPLASWLIDRSSGARDRAVAAARASGGSRTPRRSASRCAIRRSPTGSSATRRTRSTRPSTPRCTPGPCTSTPAQPLRRGRAGRDRRPHRRGQARLDGAAGELGHGARLQGLVRAQAQRHAPVARVLRRLPARARRLAAHPHAAHARSRRAALVLGLALVLRARASCSGPCRCSTRRWST